jgi:hypothetical protein
MSPGRRAAGLVLAVASSALLVASCNEIIGIDGNFRSAIGAMCTCENVANAFGGDKASCVAFFDDRLALATSSDVKDWLGRYAELGCDRCDGNYGQTKLDCVHGAPFCSKDGGGCATALDCCGYPETSACLGATVGAGICSACVTEGATCSTDEECCGYHGANPLLGYDPPYCSNVTHTCVRDPADCARSFTGCAAKTCCKGDIAGACQKNIDNPILSFCIERCDPQNAHNCPGCCSVTFKNADDTNPVGYCADGQPDECARYCGVEGEACGKGGFCTRICEPQPGVLVSYSFCFLECVE